MKEDHTHRNDALPRFDTNEDTDDDAQLNSDTDEDTDDAAPLDSDTEKDALIPYELTTADEKIIADFALRIKPIWNGHFDYSIPSAVSMTVLFGAATKIAFDASFMYIDYAKAGQELLPFVPEFIKNMSPGASYGINFILNIYFIMVTAKKVRELLLFRKLLGKNAPSIVPIAIKSIIAILYAGISSIPSVVMDKNNPSILNKLEVGIVSTVPSILGSYMLINLIVNVADYVFCHKKKTKETDDKKIKIQMLKVMKSSIADLGNRKDTDAIFKSENEEALIKTLLVEYKGLATKKKEKFLTSKCLPFSIKTPVHLFTQTANLISAYGMGMLTVDQTAKQFSIENIAAKYLAGLFLCAPMLMLYAMMTFDTSNDILDIPQSVASMARSNNPYGYKTHAMRGSAALALAAIYYFSVLSGTAALELNDQYHFSYLPIILITLIGIAIGNGFGGLAMVKFAYNQAQQYTLFSEDKTKIMAHSEKALELLELDLDNTTESSVQHAQV